MKLAPVIGLEIHVQLKTKSKMFCRCSNRGELEPPNTTICPICVGHPGALPVVNKRAVEFGILAGLAVDGRIADFSKFDRKNYFYARVLPLPPEQRAGLEPAAVGVRREQRADLARQRLPVGRAPLRWRPFRHVSNRTRSGGRMRRSR